MRPVEGAPRYPDLGSEQDARGTVDHRESCEKAPKRIQAKATMMMQTRNPVPPHSHTATQSLNFENVNETEAAAAPTDMINTR